MNLLFFFFTTKKINQAFNFHQKNIFICIACVCMHVCCKLQQNRSINQECCYYCSTSTSTYLFIYFLSVKCDWTTSVDILINFFIFRFENIRNKNK